MNSNSKTKLAQSSLANYCRTGKQSNIPGIDENRLHHYRRLVYNIIDDSLESAYPITRQLLDETEWYTIVTEFFSNHPCKSPQVWWMPKEFYNYIMEVNHPLIRKYPFLPDLLQMEWMEVELFMVEDNEVRFEKKSVNKNSRLIVNPELRLIRLSYPLHLKKAHTIEPSDKSNYFLVMHRHPQNGKVLFTDVSVFYARLIENLNMMPMSFNTLVNQTAGEFGMEINNEIITRCEVFINSALKNRLILGFAAEN